MPATLAFPLALNAHAYFADTHPKIDTFKWIIHEACTKFNQIFRN